MKFKDLESPDKTMYRLAMIISVISIICISYAILVSIMLLFNTPELSGILRDANLYRGFYNILDFLHATIILAFIIAFFGAIPYLILSLVVFVFFIIRYIKYKDKKIIKMIVCLIILGLAIFFVLEGIIIYPASGRYELNIDSRISEITNDKVKNFITERMKIDNGGGYYNRILREDYYIYDVIIKHSFPDDYDGIIHYKDSVKTEKRIFISDEESSFIKNNMKDRAQEFAIYSTLLWIAGDIIYIGLIFFTQKDLKLIAKRKETIDFEKNEGKIKIKKILVYTLITVFFVFAILSIIIMLSYSNKNNNNNLYNSNDSNVLYQNKINENVIIRVVKLDSILTQRTIVGIEKSTDGGITFEKMYGEGITIHNGAEFCFINNDIGFINDYGIVGTDGDNRSLRVTTDGGKTFKNANIIHPDSIEEENFFVEGVPYVENGVLKLQVYTLNYEKKPEKTYFTFYSDDKGLNWDIKLKNEGE